MRDLCETADPATALRAASGEDLGSLADLLANSPAATRSLSGRWVAAMMRTSTCTFFSPPSGKNSWSSSTDSSLTCSGRGMSPISVRNRVPPWARRNMPGLSLTAPVKAPLT